MDKRALIAGTLGLLTAPLAAQAQRPGRVPQVGVLWPDSGPSTRVEAFRQGLRDVGYTEGKNIVIEYRYADGKRDRLPELASELVSLKVDVIVALSTLAALPAKKSTTAIPIVMIARTVVCPGRRLTL